MSQVWQYSHFLFFIFMMAIYKQTVSLSSLIRLQEEYHHVLRPCHIFLNPYTFNLSTKLALMLSCKYRNRNPQECMFPWAATFALISDITLISQVILFIAMTTLCRLRALTKMKHNVNTVMCLHVKLCW